ncbi:hypothetical protein V8B55DRAFT_1372664 [Mucor lusitanicus]|uniref:Uncharacterized protein n=1 Tax=Mucor lusitanicus CBS 277.49 TaxID=747725 RepID=A0A168K8Y7_MUCCL|nr:hypothetical protein MUCCIDRAFT_111487 [Mucor lusitanicus CBS 277.49]
MRAFRNKLVTFAANKTKCSVNRHTILKDKHTQDLDAVRIDAPALYHLFSSDYHIYMANGVDKFTSVNAAKNQEQKLDILGNFIRVNYIENELGKRKLTFAGYFMFKDQYHLDFSGYRIIRQTKQLNPTQQAKQSNPAQQASPPLDEQSKESSKQAVAALTTEIKALRQQYTALAKDLKKLEVARMAAGNKSRRYEAQHKKRDAVLYEALRDARKAFNEVHMPMSKLQ